MKAQGIVTRKSRVGIQLDTTGPATWFNSNSFMKTIQLAEFEKLQTGNTVELQYNVGKNGGNFITTVKITDASIKATPGQSFLSIQHLIKIKSRQSPKLLS